MAADTSLHDQCSGREIPKDKQLICPPRGWDALKTAPPALSCRHQTVRFPLTGAPNTEKLHPYQ